MKDIKDTLKTTTTVVPVELKVDQPLSGAEKTQTESRFAADKGKLRLGLLMGGASSEKEISLESARHIYNSLDREKYDVLPIFVDDNRRLYLVEESLLWKNTTADVRANLEGSSQRIFYEDLRSKVDFAFIALHGKYGEEAFPGLLEILQIPNNGASVLGGALSMDKFRQREILRAVGVDVPKTVVIELDRWLSGPEEVVAEIENKIGYPFVVKPSREGSSTALSLVRAREEADEAFQNAFDFDRFILAEEVLKGVELTTLVYGDEMDLKALPPSELLKSGDFLTAQEKFLPGGAQMITPPRLPEAVIEEVKKVSLEVFQILSLKVYSRIDSFWIEGRGVIVLEPNNPPAMTPSTALWLQAAEVGLSASQFLDAIIDISLKLHSEKIGPL